MKRKQQSTLPIVAINQELECMEREIGKINQHTYQTYKEQCLISVQTIRRILASAALPAPSIVDAAKEYADKSYPIKDYDHYESDFDYRNQCDKNEQVRLHFIAGASLPGRSGDADKEGSFGWFIQDIDIILDYAISDKEKLKMIEGKIKTVCASLQQSPAGTERMFTLEEMMECYERGAKDNFKFVGLPSEFMECIVENGAEYFHLKYDIDTINNK